MNIRLDCSFSNVICIAFSDAFLTYSYPISPKNNFEISCKS